MRRTKGKYQSAGNRRRPGKRNLKPVLLTLCLLLILGTSAGLGLTMKKDAFCGDWLYGTTVYSFDGKGGGRMILPEESFPYTYEVSEDRLDLDFESESLSDSAYRYVIHGDGLTLSGVGTLDGTVYELTKRGS